MIKNILIDYDVLKDHEESKEICTRLKQRNWHITLYTNDAITKDLQQYIDDITNQVQGDYTYILTSDKSLAEDENRTILVSNTIHDANCLKICKDLYQACDTVLYDNYVDPNMYLGILSLHHPFDEEDLINIKEVYKTASSESDFSSILQDQYHDRLSPYKEIKTEKKNLNLEDTLELIFNHEEENNTDPNEDEIREEAVEEVIEESDEDIDDLLSSLHEEKTEDIVTNDLTENTEDNEKVIEDLVHEEDLVQEETVIDEIISENIEIVEDSADENTDNDNLEDGDDLDYLLASLHKVSEEQTVEESDDTIEDKEDIAVEENHDETEEEIIEETEEEKDPLDDLLSSLHTNIDEPEKMAESLQNTALQAQEIVNDYVKDQSIHDEEKEDIAKRLEELKEEKTEIQLKETKEKEKDTIIDKIFNEAAFLTITSLLIAVIYYLYHKLDIALPDLLNNLIYCYVNGVIVIFQWIFNGLHSILPAIPDYLSLLDNPYISSGALQGLFHVIFIWIIYHIVKLLIKK